MVNRFDIKNLTQQQTLFVELGLHELKRRWESEGKIPAGGMRRLDDVIIQVRNLNANLTKENRYGK